LRRANEQIKFLTQGGDKTSDNGVTINNNYNNNMIAIVGDSGPLSRDVLPSINGEELLKQKWSNARKDPRLTKINTERLGA
jgi:hypothetical protein